MIPVAFCIDVEPDPRIFDPTDPPEWSGFERLVELLPSLRAELEEATGAPAAFSWFLRMDPQVEAGWGSAAWIAEAHSDRFAELIGTGDEVGLHMHTWRWSPDAGEWVAEFEDAEWIEHCLATGLDAFESTFGHPCRIHRGGDHFLTGDLLRSLRERGVRADMTVEPGLPPDVDFWDEATRGALPDYNRVPSGPYRSSSERFPAEDPSNRDDPLLVPLTSARRRRPPFRRWTLSIESVPRVFGQRLSGRMLRPPAVLAFAMRSDSALDSRWDTVATNLRRVAQVKGARFVTGTAAAESVAA